VTPGRRLTAVLLLALTVSASAAAGALAAKHHGQPAAPYVNPFTSPVWLASRTDMGVDWDATQATPVVAIGDAVVLGSESHSSGWPGRHLIWYQLTDGSHAGDVIYVAEHLRNLVPAGTTVRAGQTLATAVAGYPGTEWGWADKDGAPRAAACYHEGMQTNSGREMARFLTSLGVQVQQPPGPGPAGPSGKRC
jgi:hypothetical protein